MHHLIDRCALALVLAGTFAHAQAPDPSVARAVQRQGNALAAAMLREDYAAVAATACSPVLARVGGAHALAQQIEAGFKLMRQQGRRLLRMHFGPASALFDGAQTGFALVPYRSVVRVGDGRVALDSFYLGVKNHDADSWCFVDTAALTEQGLHELFPGAPAALRLPPPSRTVIEREAAVLPPQ